MHAGRSNSVDTILMIDEDPIHLRVLERQIQQITEVISPSNPRPRLAAHTSARRAIDDLPDDGLCIIISDYDMPGGDGLAWLPKFIHAEVGPVILLTSQGSEKIAAEAFREGAADYLIKDEALADPMRFGQALHDAVRRYRLEKINRKLKRELKQATRDLSLRNKRLTEMSETALRFVDDVAHDFRTPLTIVQEYALLMGDGLAGPVTDDQQDYLQTILAAVNEMTHMVEDFLDSSRLRAQAVRMDRCASPIETIIEPVVELIKPQAKAHRVHVETDFAEDLDRVFTDRTKARRVLINLAVNAIKVAPEHSTITLYARGTDDDSIELGVRDQGPGLDPEEQKRIFERFEQAGDLSAHSARKGLGLGLSIATQLAKLNLGPLALASEKGRGSTFYFTLPVNRPKVILRAYQDQVMPLKQAGRPAMLRLTAGPNWKPGQLRSWLASVISATNLILEDARGRSVAVVGIWEDLDAKIKSIQKAARERAQRLSKPDDRIRIKILEQWERNTPYRILTAEMNDCLERNLRDLQKHPVG